MLNRNILGVFRVHDPDNLLDEHQYGFMLYDPVHPEDSICYTCSMDLGRSYPWDSLPILKEAVTCDTEVPEEDRDEDTGDYEEKLFDINYKLFNQNTLKYLRLGYDEWMELEDLAIRGDLHDLAKLIAEIKQPLKQKWLQDNGYTDDGDEDDRQSIG